MTAASYWDQFESTIALSAFGRTLEARHGRQNYRTFTLPGVNWSTIHLAAVLSTTTRGTRLPGNRVQLVFMRGDGPQFREFEQMRPEVDAAIPMLHWVDRELGNRSHVEVWKPDNFLRPANWPEDFAWLLDYLERFQQLAPLAVEAVRRSKSKSG